MEDKLYYAGGLKSWEYSTTKSYQQWYGKTLYDSNKPSPISRVWVDGKGQLEGSNFTLLNDIDNPQSYVNLRGEDSRKYIVEFDTNNPAHKDDLKEAKNAKDGRNHPVRIKVTYVGVMNEQGSGYKYDIITSYLRVDRDKMPSEIVAPSDTRTYYVGERVYIDDIYARDNSGISNFTVKVSSDGGGDLPIEKGIKIESEQSGGKRLILNMLLSEAVAKGLPDLQKKRNLEVTLTITATDNSLKHNSSSRKFKIRLRYADTQITFHNHSGSAKKQSVIEDGAPFFNAYQINRNNPQQADSPEAFGANYSIKIKNPSGGLLGGGQVIGVLLLLVI